MTVTIDNAYIETFERSIRHLAQQGITRLRPCVMEVNEQSERHNWDRLAQSAAVQKVSARVPTPVGGDVDFTADPQGALDWTRRQTLITTFHTGEIFEAEDPVQMLIDPQSRIVMNLGMNMKRAVDDIIIEASIGLALDGDGATVAFPASQKVGDGTTAITLDTVLEVQEKFLEADIDWDEPKCFVIGPTQQRKLLQLMEVTSGDFQNHKALTDGYLPNWLGFTWIVSTRLTDTTLTDVSIDCLAFSRKALGLHVAKDITARVAERVDLSFAWQVYCHLSMDCVRVEDEHIVHVDLIDTL